MVWHKVCGKLQYAGLIEYCVSRLKFSHLWYNLSSYVQSNVFLLCQVEEKRVIYVYKSFLKMELSWPSLLKHDDV